MILPSRHAQHLPRLPPWVQPLCGLGNACTADCICPSGTSTCDSGICKVGVVPHVAANAVCCKCCNCACVRAVPLTWTLHAQQAGHSGLSVIPPVSATVQAVCGQGKACSNCVCPASFGKCSGLAPGVCTVSGCGHWAPAPDILLVRPADSSRSGRMGRNLAAASLVLSAPCSAPLQPWCVTGKACNGSCVCPPGTNQCDAGICKVGWVLG